MPVVSGKAEYSPDILNELKAMASVNIVDAFDEAVALGNTKVLNIILLGTTVGMMGLGQIDWNDIIAKEVKPAFVALNQKAFATGLSLAS